MDFSRKMFHEITVEREGYFFNVEVAYEWLPDFCSHCQNIGHDVTICRWHFPRQDNNAHKQLVAQGKKPVPTKKQTWIPTTENPSGIGSSLAFAGPQQDVTPALTAEVPPHPDPTAEVFPPPAPHNSATVVPPIHAATEEVASVRSEAVPMQQLETHPESVAPPSPQLGSLEKEVPEQNNTSTTTFIALEATLHADDVAEHAYHCRRQFGATRGYIFSSGKFDYCQ